MKKENFCSNCIIDDIVRPAAYCAEIKGNTMFYCYSCAEKYSHLGKKLKPIIAKEKKSQKQEELA